MTGTAMISLPCETTIVTRQQLARSIKLLRTEGQVVPVLIGLDEDLERLAECHAHADDGFASILKQADSIDVAAFFADREHAWQHQHRTEVEGILQQAATNPGSFSDDIGRDIINDYKRMLAAGDFRENRREDILGNWPLKPQPSPDFLRELGNWSFSAWPQLGEILRSQARRQLALLPVQDDSQAFAYLAFGGWNDSPEPAEHVAVFRYWASKYDVELFQIDDHRMHCTVGAPPENRDEALELAWQQFFYCNHILDNGPRNISELASLLLNGKSWAFWWE